MSFFKRAEPKANKPSASARSASRSSANARAAPSRVPRRVRRPYRVLLRPPRDMDLWLDEDRWMRHLEQDGRMMRAVRAMRVSEVERLLEDGYKPDAFYGEDEESALEVASEMGNIEIVGLLLQYGAHPDISQNGYTPLMKAANADVARMLLDAGANPNAALDTDLTPLMFAAMDGKADVVRVLLRRGAQTNARDEMGMTARDHAREAGHENIVNMLSSE